MSTADLLLARRLSAAASRLDFGARRRATPALRTAFPELEAKRIARLASDACAYRRLAVFDGVAACRFDPRALCRRLTLECWSRLDAAESRGQGLLVLGAGFGAWQLAALAVALYRGPIKTLGRWRDDSIFGRLATALERRSGLRLFDEQAEQRLEQSLRAGDRIGFLADRTTGHGETVTLPFLGRTLQAETLVAQASIDTGAPVVPVFGRPRAPGGWSVEVREPIYPAAANAPALTTRYLAAVEEEVRRRPELWLGWWSHNL